MRHILDYTDMDRETAILLFDGKIYESDSNHQFLLQDILSNKYTNLDTEDIDFCKALERESGMCAIDHFFDGEESYLCIQSLEYLQFADVPLLRKLWLKYDQCKIGFCNSAYESVCMVYDDFTEFEYAFKSTLKGLQRGIFALVDLQEQVDTSLDLYIIDVATKEVDKVSEQECKDYLSLGLVIQGVNYLSDKDVNYVVQHHYRDLLPSSYKFLYDCK